MKKLLVVVLGAFLVTAFAGNAFAQAGDPPPGSTESQVFYWVDGVGWVANPAPDERNGRLFRAGEIWDGNCNAKYWSTDVYIYAHIAQWIDFRLDYTEWHWYIRKPGCYAGNSIDARIASNGDVYIDFENFGVLMPMGPDDQDHNPIDSIFYSYEDQGGGINDAEANGWVWAPDMNLIDVTLYDLAPWDLHYGVGWKLWTKICVDECNSACDYWDVADITLVLQQQKDWITDDGNWGPGF
jgi:hypothetical protein